MLPIKHLDMNMNVVRAEILLQDATDVLFTGALF